MAQDMRALHINTNFAPVVDVNTNPFNPVINVRAFSDDKNTVSRLAEKMVAGMKHQGLITAYKHFPAMAAPPPTRIPVCRASIARGKRLLPSISPLTSRPSIAARRRIWS